MQQIVAVCTAKLLDDWHRISGSPRGSPWITIDSEQQGFTLNPDVTMCWFHANPDVLYFKEESLIELAHHEATKSNIEYQTNTLNMLWNSSLDKQGIFWKRCITSQPSWHSHQSENAFLSAGYSKITARDLNSEHPHPRHQTTCFQHVRATASMAYLWYPRFTLW